MRRYCIYAIGSLLASLTACADPGRKPVIEPAPAQAATGSEPPGARAQSPGPAARPGQPGDAFADPEIAIERAGSVQRIAIRVAHTPGVLPRTGDVIYTAEPYTLALVPDANQVLESDLLGTGLAMDLDGDGEARDVLAVACNADGSVQVGSTRVAPLAGAGEQSFVYRDSAGASRVARIGDSGAHVVLYQACSDTSVSVGLSPADQPMELHELPGPVLQVLVLEQASGPAGTPRSVLDNMTLDGEPIAVEVRVSHIYEPIFASAPGWATAVWVMVPLGADARDHELRLDATLAPGSAATRRLVIASISERGDAHDRVRTHLTGRPLTRAAEEPDERR